MIRQAATPIPGLPLQDPTAYWLLHNSLLQVKRGCRKLGLPVLKDVTVGSIGRQGINAFATDVFGAANVIGVHDSWVPLVNNLFKSVVLVHGVTAGDWLLFDPDGHREHDELAARCLRDAVRVARGLEHEGPHDLPNDFGEALYAHLLCGIDAFTVGHEYSHLLFRKLEMEFDSKAEELEADATSLYLIASGSNDDSALVELLAPLIFFTFWWADDHARGKELSSASDATHPSPTERIQGVLRSIHQIAGPEGKRTWEAVGALWPGVRRTIWRLWPDTIEFRGGIADDRQLSLFE